MIRAFLAKVFDRAIVGLRRSPVAFAAAAPIAAALLAALPARALAAEELWLRWFECASSGVQANVFSCPVPTLPRAMVVAACPAADVEQVVGTTMVLDVLADAATLPNWWQLGPGGCRAGRLDADADFSQVFGCADAWSAAGVALIQVYGLRPGGGPNELRLVVAGGVPAAGAVVMPGGEPRAIARLVMDLADAPTTTCSGCGLGACIVLNSVELVRLPGAPGGNVTLVQPASDGSNFAIWQSGAACVTVPARNRSWGQIKAMYR